MTLKSVYFVSHMQNPSWCFVVKQRYSMPASCIRSSHFSGLNLRGLKLSIYFTYLSLGIFFRHIICSCHAGIEYIPQCTNIPNLFSKNQLRLPQEFFIIILSLLIIIISESQLYNMNLFSQSSTFKLRINILDSCESPFSIIIQNIFRIQKNALNLNNS